MNIVIADKQRISYAELFDKVIPEYLEKSSYVKDNRYKVSFRLYPLDTINTIEENGNVCTILKTFCDIEDLDTNESQSIIIDLLKVPVYQELGFKIGGNYKQILDLYERPTGWSFTKSNKDDKGTIVEAKLSSISGKSFCFRSSDKGPYFTRKLNMDKSDVIDDKVPIDTLFRAISGYSNSELLELFGYDNQFNSLCFDDSNVIRIKKKEYSKNVSRDVCIERVHGILFGKSKTNETVDVETRLKNIQNWFFKKSYLNLGEGNRKRFEYMQSFRSRALNQVLAEDVILQDEVIEAGSILNVQKLELIDNSPVTQIKVEIDGKVHSLHKFATFTFRALGYVLAENVNCDGLTMRAGTKLTLSDLAKLNSTSLSTIKAYNGVSKNKSLVTFTRDTDGSVLTIDQLFTAYSIFSNNMNGYSYYNDIDELTDKIVVTLDKKILSLVEKNLNIFMSKLNSGLDIVKTNGYIIDALADFSLNLNKNELMDMLRDVETTESQLADYNNVISFIAKDFKVNNKIGGNSVTDSVIGVHGLQFGRLDPYDSPESGKIGKVHHRTILAREDSDGNLLAPYTPVENGEISDEVAYLTAVEEKDVYIAEWNETFHNEDGSKKDRVRVRYQGELLNVDTDLVTYKEYSNIQNFSPTTGCIPFCNFAAGKRVQMSDNQQKQAVSTLKTERARVCTGVESLLNIGVYKAPEVLERYYNEQLYNCPELEQYKDIILHSDLQLVRIKKQDKLRKLVYKVIAVSSLYLPKIIDEVTLEIPFAQNTLKSDMFSYKINSSTGGFYNCNDVLAYNTSYDMKEYELTGLKDYGELKVDDDQLQGSVALGHNYSVAFKTMESSSIDDGIVISSRIVADDTITSIMIHKETVELLQSRTTSEVFEAPRKGRNGNVIDNFEVNGLPKIGTYIAPGGVVAYKKVTRTSQSRDANKGSKQEYKAVNLNPYVEGQVISTKFVTKSNGKCAEIYVACRASGEVADKFAGRIGNKGVVAKIIPEEMMPYDPETGQSIDFILNPLGVPSRMNITQLLEVTLSAVAVKKDEIAIVSPFHPNALNFVLEEAKANDIKPKRLIDGRTGQYFEREINIGYQHMYKLVHMARKNIHAVGLQHGVNAVTLQAKQSAKLNGGQSFGEMESWCLESIGAYQVLQELQSTLSDDRDARNKLDRFITRNPYEVHVEGTNHNDVTMTTLLRLLCCSISTGADESGDSFYEFTPLTDKEIRSFSVTSINKDNLHSSEIFGTNNGVINKMRDRHLWGWVDLGTEIIHPIWVEKGSLASLFVYKEPVSSCINPANVDEITWNLKIKQANTGLLKSLIDGQKFILCCENTMGYLRIINSKMFATLDADSQKLFKTGFDAISYVFRHYSMEKSLIEVELRIQNRNTESKQNELTLDEMKSHISTGSTESGRHTSCESKINELCSAIGDNPADAYIFAEDNKQTLAWIKLRNAIKDFIEKNLQLEDYLITSFPVMPAIFRQGTEIQGRQKKNDFDVHYEAIINAADTARSNNCENTKYGVYKAIKNFIGLTDQNSDKKKVYDNVLSWFVGKSNGKTTKNKHGKIRDTVQKKIIGRSGRAIIIPSDDPARSPLFLGLPLSMAVRIFEEQLIAHLSRHFKHTPPPQFKLKRFAELFKALGAKDIVSFNKIYNESFSDLFGVPVISAATQITAWIKEFIEGSDGKAVEPSGIVLQPQVVLFGRQPSLHRYSVRAFYVKVVETNAIQVHPLMCSGYNADFDGDQMWLCALISEEAKAEAIAKMTVKSDIVNPKDGKIILSHSQDIALGMYVLTMLKDNALAVDNKDVQIHYSNLELVRCDILNGILHTYDIISVKVNGKTFVSTAGRILFNSLLPDGFTSDIGTFTNKLGLNINKPERYAELQYDGLITSGKSADNYNSYSLPKICKSLYEQVLDGQLLIDKLIDIYQAISELGFRISDRHSVSISIFDLRAIADKSNKKAILEEAESLHKRIEEDYLLGLLSHNDKVACTNSIYDKAFKDIEVDIFGNGKDKLGSLDRNNNIFIMFDSGARGSKSQIMQSIAVVGKLQKTKDTDLELPVLGNYSEGLSSFDFQMLAYSTRTGMASTQNETKDAGYGTRRAVHCLAGIEISELDCGKKDWWYDIEWGDRLNDLTVFKPSQSWFSNNLLGVSVDMGDQNTVAYFGNTLRNGFITEESYDILKDGFHQLKLKDKVITADVDMLISAKPIDENSIKYLGNFTHDGFLLQDAIHIINKRHLKHVETDIGTFEFRYELSKLSRSLLENREGRNMPGLRLYTGPLHNRLSTDMYIITDETLRWIETSGTERIEARILLDCETGSDDYGKANKTLHSCCARCYGLKYTSNTLPEVNENVGIEASQAVGEPAAQLTLSLVNKGGASGESVASGVAILHKLLNGSTLFVDKAKTITYVTKESGYLNVNPIDKEVTITLSNENGELDATSFLNNKRLTRINPKLLICKNKEYVNAGEAITSGYVLPNDIISTPEGTLESLIRKKQTTWLYNWFKTFDDNNIYINARHFELFTKAQMSDMVVVKSNNPAYKIGERYKVSDVLHAGNDVVGILVTNNTQQTILNSSGAMTVLSYENITGSLPKLVQSRYRSYKNSAVGGLNVGENLVRKDKKVFTKYHPSVTDSVAVTEGIRATNDNLVFITDETNVSSTLSSINLFEELDNLSLDNMDDFDLNMPETATDTTNSVEESTVNDMDLFGSTVNEDIPVNGVYDISYVFLTEFDYTPISNLNVALVQNGSIIGTATTDEFGNANFDNVKGGYYTVKVLSDKAQGDLEKVLNVYGEKEHIDEGVWTIEYDLSEYDETDEYTSEDNEDEYDSDDYEYGDDYDSLNTNKNEQYNYMDMF